MRHKVFTSAVLVLALAALSSAGPLSFLFFWSKGKPKFPAKDMKTGESAEIADLVSETANRKCENWAWAAALQTALKAQQVEIPQNYWIIKVEGGELCKDAAPDFETQKKVIQGEYRLDDGRKVRLEANFVSGAPTDMDSLILAPREKRPLVFIWKGHAYVYRGLEYNELIATTGNREFEVQRVELLDPFFDTAEKQSAAFLRAQDDPNDINGVLDVKVVPVTGTDWLHPEKELEHPTEIYFPH